jgi:hypothetical protein
VVAAEEPEPAEPVPAEAEPAEAEPAQAGAEGGYVGDEPPAGYEIKGNARSKKYHQPGQSRYAVTTADVWFNSVEAAEAAGFQAAKS